MELVRSAEQAYERQIISAAEQVFDRREESPVLLLSGPSASSKTTTAGKIAAQLERLGVQTAVISLDDFFKNRADLPLLPNGETDFESIHTLDLDTLRACFNTLLAAGEAAFPTFDFTSGARAEEVRRVKAGHGTVLIVEGIHALNPQITENCARDGFQLRGDGGVIVPEVFRRFSGDGFGIRYRFIGLIRQNGCGSEQSDK